VAQPVRKQVWLSEIDPLIRETVASGGTFRITVTGTSNQPTLKGGRDEVTLSRVGETLRRYDLPLYRRDNGQYVLHRIVAVRRDGTYTCCGDHQWHPEPGIRRDQIIACVSSICRKGREFPVTARSYRLWVRVWCFLLPLRGVLIRVCHVPAKLRRLFKRQSG
jgi:hypothetical protein